METVVNEIFGPNGIGLCVKDSNRKVLYQNAVIEQMCGSMTSCVCEKGCMKQYSGNSICPARAEGAHLFSNRLHDGSDRYVDYVVLNSGEKIVTLVYPLDNKHEKEFAFLQDKGLSKRESEIAWMVIRGSTNTEITKKLGISKATLKTHLNNIYKKLPADTKLGFRRRTAL